LGVHGARSGGCKPSGYIKVKPNPTAVGFFFKSPLNG
jgi:hypothetical protein